ncbi:MAG: hypothetical protein AAGG51_14045 [Cyanobacteria bacterium P01_G01_bin.54]
MPGQGDPRIQTCELQRRRSPLQFETSAIAILTLKSATSHLRVKMSAIAV